MSKREIRTTMRRLVVGVSLLLGGQTLAQSWRFGILADTQWPREAWYVPSDALGNPLSSALGGDSIVVVSVDSLGGWKNPHSVAADFIHQIHGRFREHGVSMVVATGDLADESTLEAIRSRATWAQELYESGIGFFPIRGNHDATAEVAAEFMRLFPQTRDGIQRRIPEDATLWTDSAQLHPFRNLQAGDFALGSGFSSPPGAEGRSYAFQLGGATFALLDPFPGPDGGVLRASQQLEWLDGVLARRPPQSPAFVFCHYPLLGAYHSEQLFGASPLYDTASQNAFVRMLRTRGVRVYMAGHDHLLQNSLVASSTDPREVLQQIILPGASFKFYPPSVPSVDELYNLGGLGISREIPLAQDLGQIGYLVGTVEGNRVELEAWGAPSGIVAGEIFQSMDLSGKWTLRRRWGWSETGKEVLVPPGGAYAVLADSALGTSARIPWGSWEGDRTDAVGRKMSQWITSDWGRHGGMASASWTLWGMERDEGSPATTPFVLELSIDPLWNAAGAEGWGVVRRDSTRWSLAGRGAPRWRAWTSADTVVGVHGLDTGSRRAWVVVDRAGTFAVGEPGTVRLRDAAKSPPTRPLLWEGRKVTVPPAWMGRRVEFEARGIDGAVLARQTTTRSFLIPRGIEGVVIVRARTLGERDLVEGGVLAR